MMQEFKPDCTIYLHVEGSGKPIRYAWACSLSLTGKGNLVLARKYLGIVSRESAELEAVLFGVSQAVRLQQEKVEVVSSFSPAELFDDSKRAGRYRDPDLNLKKAELIEKWNLIRLRRAREGRSQIPEDVKSEVKRIFSRSKDQEGSK